MSPTPSRHRALVVDDDLSIAEAIGELLDSLNIGHIHAASAEEARALMNGVDVCLALVDIQIKANASSVLPATEAGITLLEDLRRIFPARNDADKHMFQILAMSGHCNRAHEVARATLIADNFIEKPFTQSPISLAEHVRLCLRHGGRSHHGECERLNREARVQRRVGSNPSWPSAVDRTIRLLGPLPGKRHSVVVAGQARSVRAASMRILQALIYARQSGGGEWVDKNDLGQGAPGANGFSRLRDDLGDPTFIESNGEGCYRIAPDVVVVPGEAAKAYA